MTTLATNFETGKRGLECVSMEVSESLPKCLEQHTIQTLTVHDHTGLHTPHNSVTSRGDRPPQLPKAPHWRGQGSGQRKSASQSQCCLKRRDGCLTLSGSDFEASSCTLILSPSWLVHSIQCLKGRILHFIPAVQAQPPREGYLLCPARAVREKPGRYCPVSTARIKERVFPPSHWKSPPATSPQPVQLPFQDMWQRISGVKWNSGKGRCTGAYGQTSGRWCLACKAW